LSFRPEGAIFTGGIEVSVAAKKQIQKAEKSPAQPEAMPQSFKQALASSIAKVEAVLKTLPADKLAQVKKEADKILQGDLSWADLSQYTPEKLLKIAELGYEQFRLGQYDRSERIFKGLTVVDPDNYYYHQMLGATFQRKEKFPEAIVEYSVAADLNPKDLVSLTNRGEIYFKLGIYELAGVDFDRAIALDAKSDDQWANRSRMLKEQVKLVAKRK
jgi:Flp pilus assembly protein TadD